MVPWTWEYCQTCLALLPEDSFRSQLLLKELSQMPQCLCGQATSCLCLHAPATLRLVLWATPWPSHQPIISLHCLCIAGMRLSVSVPPPAPLARCCTRAVGTGHILHKAPSHLHNSAVGKQQIKARQTQLRLRQPGRAGPRQDVSVQPAARGLLWA